MNCISAEGLGKSYNEKWLFSDLTFGVNEGEKVALIGKNGAGKSTLLRLLSKTEPPDHGEVVHNNSVRVVYLPQEPEIDPQLSVWQIIFDDSNPMAKLVRQFELAQADPEFDADAMSEIMGEMDNMKAWDYENVVHETLAKLGITNLEQRAGSLSGGQKRRLAIASMILMQPDVFILDEPTNHLDIEAIEWLENLLNSKNITLIMVSHDRYFIDRVCNRIIELEPKGLMVYKGNYAYYLEKKAERLQIAAVEQQKAKQLMLKELEWMRRQPQARGTKSKSRIEAFYEIKDKASVKIDNQKLELTIRGARQGSKILELHHIVHSFNGEKIINDFSYVFKTGEKVGIVGRNGAGKSTLINIASELLKPEKGSVVVGQTTVFGYFSQNSAPLNPENRLIEEVREIADNVLLNNGKTITAVQFLERFLFRKEQHYTPIGKLSGGEKRRLQLLKILMTAPNFLILDEPTNDFDIDTLNVLEDFLENFPGNVIVVSHDRYFLDRVCDHIFGFEDNGKIKDFPGNYTDYREWKLSKDKQKNAEAASVKVKTVVTEQVPKEIKVVNEKRKISFKEKFELESLNNEIAQLEQEKVDLANSLHSDKLPFQELTKISERIEEIVRLLEEKEMRWLELSELVEN